MRSARYSFLIGAIAVVLITLDQLTKNLAVAHLSTTHAKQVIGSLVQLQLTYNSGAAFSTGAGATWIFTVLAVAATVAIGWAIKRCDDRIWAVALGILLAGVDGNLIDRMCRAPGGFQGRVVDFIALPHWPIFNVADMCINVAAVLIVIQTVRGVRLNGTREKKA